MSRYPELFTSHSPYLSIIIYHHHHQQQQQLRFPWPSSATRPYRPLFSRPCEGGQQKYIAYKLALLQQCPTCLARVIWMAFEMGGRCTYSCCFVGCCLQDLFNTVRSILVQLPSCVLSIRFVSIHVVHPYSSIFGKKLCFILSDRSDFLLADNLSIADHAFASCV